MQVWQLQTVIAENPAAAETIAQTESKWQYLADWFSNYEQLVHQRDWEKVCHVLPQDFVIAVLKTLQTKCYQASDGWLRAWRLYDDDAIYLPLAVYEKYGDEVLEDLMDHFAARPTH